MNPEKPVFMKDLDASLKGGTYKPFMEAFIDLTAGSAGGIACVLVGQPLDTIKVKMQTFPSIYRNSIQCFKQTFLQEHIRGLYAGTVPALVANVAENSVLFCAYGCCQSAVNFLIGKPSVQDLNPLENAFAGFLAAFFSTFTLCPTELIKCRLQAMREMNLKSGANSKQYPTIGPWIITKQILKREGIPGLFRGLKPTFVREMPGYFFFFGGYEISRLLMTPKGKTKDEIGPIKTVVAGGIGGVSLWIAIFPFDVVKSRIQIAGSQEPMFAMIGNIARNEGFRSLYKGLGPTILRTFPACGALFVAYEYTKKCLRYCSGLED